MPRTRSLSHILDGTTVTFLYRRTDPSTGLYYDSAKVTACTVEVRNIESPTTALLAATAMTYDAALKGWKYVWTYAAALNGVRAVSVLFSPTRDSSVAAALAPEEAMEVDLHDVLERIDSHEANRATMQTTIVAFVDEIESRLGTNAEAATDPSAASGTVFSKLRGGGADLDAVKTVVDLIEDVLVNRLKLDTATGEWVLYADNGTTELRRWQAKDVSGNLVKDATTPIIERNPL